MRTGYWPVRHFITLPRVTKRDRRLANISLLIGLLATVGVIVVYLLRGFERLELITYDWRVLWTNSTRVDPRIVCLYIDDQTLERAGRWPWPREVQAALLGIPAELGATSILADITYVEPQPLHTVEPPDMDVTYWPDEFDESLADVELPDYVMSRTIQRAGNVFLAFHHPEPDVERADDFREVVDLLLAGKLDAAQRRATEVSARLRNQIEDTKIYNAQQPWLRARMVATIERQPMIESDAVLKLLDVRDPGTGQFVAENFERTRLTAYRRIVEKSLNADPRLESALPKTIFVEIYPLVCDRPLSSEDIYHRTLAQALREVLGYRATARGSLLAPEHLNKIRGQIDGISPVYFMHARAARGCGFVNFKPDRDGVMRREQLLARHGQSAFTQLAFRVACHELGVDTGRIDVSAGRIILRPRDAAPRVIQLEDSRTIVPWMAGTEWTQQFPHVSASAIHVIHSLRRQRQNNAWLIERNRIALGTHPSYEGRAEYEKYAGQREQLRRKVRVDFLKGDDEGVTLSENGLAEIEKLLAEHDARAAQWITASAGESFAPLKAALGNIAELQRLGKIAELQRVNERIATEIDAQLRELRPSFEGKICLIGYTATSLADMTPIPTNKRAPGVLAHANMLNGLLTNQLVRWAPTWVNALLAAVVGAIFTFASASLRPRAASGLMLPFLAAYAALGGAMTFFLWNFSLALTPVFFAAVVPFLLISTFRYVFIDSERRQLATALGQYTSKEIARQMAENPELCQRAESREVTAMFTDLKGFTTISERIGAERTQKVLNICLGEFTDVMLRHAAMVNKFIGDGIFAFWNPVIFPQPDHAVRACETAIDLHVGLAELKREMLASGGDDVFAELMLRIGVATGNAIVGPCGSEQKYDYTCIGDSVNLAARLESANKFFGTRILVAGPVVERVGDDFVFRSLGGVRVKGKTNAVPVHELIGRRGQVPGDAVEYAARFADAVAMFQRREWKLALGAFDDCTRLRPDDLAAREYYDATAVYLARPPGANWNGAIELAEK